MTARRAAFLALKKVAEGAYSTIALGEVLSSSGMDARDKSLASTIFYGVLENELMLDHIIRTQQSRSGIKIERDARILLRMGLYQMSFLDKIPDSAAINETVELAKRSGAYRAAGFINAMLRGYLRAGKGCELPDRDKEPERYLSLKYSCPIWLISLWKDSYGMDICEDILSSLSGRAPIYVRVNDLLIEPDALVGQIRKCGAHARLIDILPDAAALEDTGEIETLEPFEKGYMHVQDISSQLCCRMLSAKAGDTVLDVCSAPGGKAYTVAEMMGDSGRVIACDIHPHRVRLIESGARRLRLKSIEAKVRDALVPDDIMADKVMCDVPCSGLGIIRRKPDIKSKNRQDIDQLPKLQYDILKASSCAVKRGGTLLYSTCTLNRAENGDVVTRFLSENDEFEPYPLELPCFAKRLIDEEKHMYTIFPSAFGSDGFFIARMRRKD